MQNSEYDQKLLRRQQCSARLDCNGIATASVDLHGSHAYNLVKL